MSKQSKQTEPVDVEESVSSVGKGRPTPKRKDKEKLNERPLISNDRKEARERMRQEREKARVGMERGDDRYLPARDKGPQRRFVRGIVDARFNLGEFMIPVMVIVILISVIPNQYVSAFSILILWVYVLAVIGDSMVLGRAITKRVGAKFGDDNLERGLRWYGTMRAIQMRRLRLPKPQNARGEWPS